MIIDAFKTERQKRRKALTNNISDKVFKILDSFPMKLAYAVLAIIFITSTDESRHEIKETNQTTYRH